MEFEDLRFLDPYSPVFETRNRLPHWQQHGAAYFVTFHLGDALSADIRLRWEEERDAWARLHPPPRAPELERAYAARLSAALERLLDAGCGRCLLRQPALARVVGDALAHFDGERCAQLAWVVMPNHVHALCVPRDGGDLARLVHSWKRYSARAINRRIGGGGRLWQRDYHDRLIRGIEHLMRCVRYIRENPIRARLRPGEYVHYENDLARGIG